MSPTSLLTSNNMALSPLHQSALSSPSHPAIISRANGAKLEISYTELSRRVIAMSEQLSRQGLNSGDRLACIDSNSIELIILYWACIDLGVLYCPLSPKFPIEQVVTLTQQHRFNYLWAGAKYEPLFSSCALATTKLTLDFTATSLHQAAKVTVNTAANIILTSGSSGEPKAAVHSLNNHIASAKGSSTLIPLQAGDGWLLSLPLFHIGGLAIVNRCALAGATVVMQDKAMSLAAQLSQDPITHLSLVSTQLVRLLDADTGSGSESGAEFGEKSSSCLKAIKSLLLGGGAISIDLIDKLKTLSISSFTSYGMTEMSSQITTGAASHDGNSGQTILGREVKILDELIYVKGETLFLGYLHWQENQPQLILPLDNEGWFATKDRGYWNKQGNLHILGRSDNMFICGGENVQPEEIEAALKQHPDIEDAIVFPQPNNEFGNLPAAIIKCSGSKDVESKISESKVEAFTGLEQSKELEHFLTERIARFKRPRMYYPWPEIESVSLKVSRKQMIEAVLKGAKF